MSIKEDTGGGCSVCGENEGVRRIKGTYWLCAACRTDAAFYANFPEYFDRWEEAFGKFKAGWIAGKADK